MTSSELPAWYYRVAAAVKKRNGVILWGFDEDIPDLDEASQDEAITYNGPDATDYHRLREKREERKRELFRRKEVILKRKEEAREEEKKRVDEVRAAYEALEISMSRGETTQLGPPTASSIFTRRCIKFECADGGEVQRNDLSGRFWLNPKVDFELVPFKSLQGSSLKHHEIQTTDGRFSIALQFIDKDHLILRQSRDLVFWGTPQDSRGPETFIFMGVRNDWGKQLQAFARML
ncbi:hypothetical protein LZL87_012551 [Fusarium oxysporum]|nr:hypothetical protein LZL87_012551 [Fusarium oxysporum]